MSPTAAVAADGTPWLDTAELQAWRAYIETVFDLNTALEGDLAPTGLSLGDYQVLVHLNEAPERSMRMCDLAARLQLSPSGMTRRLDGLVRDGLVTRVPGETDRRVMRAELTGDGERRLRQAAPTHVASVRRRLLDHLDPADVAALARIFTAVHGALHGSHHGSRPAGDRPA